MRTTRELVRGADLPRTLDVGRDDLALSDHLVSIFMVIWMRHGGCEILHGDEVRALSIKWVLLTGTSTISSSHFSVLKDTVLGAGPHIVRLV